MRRILLTVALIGSLASAAAAQQPILAKPKADVAATQFNTVLTQALTALARSGSYALEVESQWGAMGEATGPQGGSHYRLIWQGGKYRVEVQSNGATTPELLCVNDGQQVTTLFPARGLYSQHPVNAPQASIEANTMLAMSLQGSAIDILLQRDVAGFVRTQATGLQDHGVVLLDGVRAHHFEVIWAGAKVQLWFAAEGDPLLLQFTRTTSVPTGENKNYEMLCTAKYHWKLGVAPPEGAFTLALPTDVRRVDDIYKALSGSESSTHIGKPLPSIQLGKLDGSEIELAAAPDKKATVLIFWATWCASSVQDLPAVSQFIKAYKDRGVAFYAINVGEQPGEVRRFTSKSPLVSTVLLDPRGKASAALEVAELPAIVIVGQDNNVRAILHGSAKELQGELSNQLEALISGSKASTAQRPPQSKGIAK
jgi:thiol-disulfide isomerase/thioredoxin